jgi:hypothetical protein
MAKKKRKLKVTLGKKKPTKKLLVNKGGGTGIASRHLRHKGCTDLGRVNFMVAENVGVTGTTVVDHHVSSTFIPPRNFFPQAIPQPETGSRLVAYPLKVPEDKALAENARCAHTVTLEVPTCGLDALLGERETTRPVHHFYERSTGRRLQIGSLALVEAVNRNDVDEVIQQVTSGVPLGHRGVWFYDPSLFPPGHSIEVGTWVCFVSNGALKEIGEVTALIRPDEEDRKWCSRINDRGFRWVSRLAEVTLGLAQLQKRVADSNDGCT